MKDEVIVSVLVKLDEKEFHELGRAKKYGHPEARLKLLELGFSILSDDDMSGFRKLYKKAEEVKAEKIAAERLEKDAHSRKELAEAIKKVENRIVILTPGQANVTVEGVKLLWQCPKCGENQEADLSKSEDDLKFLKVNDKYVNLYRRSSRGPPPRAIAGGEKLLFKEPGAMRMSESSMSGRDVGVVSMPAQHNSAAVIRLARGETIFFEFGCGKCNFRNREIKVGVTA